LTDATRIDYDERRLKAELTRSMNPPAADRALPELLQLSASLPLRLFGVGEAAS
jgi:hypothetical protein